MQFALNSAPATLQRLLEILESAQRNWRQESQEKTTITPNNLKKNPPNPFAHPWHNLYSIHLMTIVSIVEL